MDKHIKKAVEVLKGGGIVIFPTDTAFGIGCLIDNEKAVKRLFKIRKRPETQATPVLVDTVKMAQNYLKPIPQEVIDQLVEPYWPGALTIVLESRTDKVPELVRGSTSTLGVRIPSHPIARSIIRNVGAPILGPSANFHGEKTPYSFEDLDPELVKLVDYVVPGECTVKQASTVIDCSTKTWKVLREGAIKISNFKFPISNFEKIIVNIDTSSNEEISVGVEINGKKDLITEKVGKQKAQVVLPLVEQLLKKHNLTLQNITNVQVHTGPGSFTGLRVGISIANALGFALKIPVNALEIGKFVEAVYE